VEDYLDIVSSTPYYYLAAILLLFVKVSRVIESEEGEGRREEKRRKMERERMLGCGTSSL
jgi:hypothetical protein